MKIKKITSQNRRDFSAIMVCQFCDEESVNNYGYDDNYYHTEVIPNMVCLTCKKSTISEGSPIEYTQTKYPEGQQI